MKEINLLTDLFRNLLPFFATNYWIFSAKAFWSQNIEICIADLVRYKRICLLETIVKLLVAIAMWSREKAIISQSTKILAGSNWRWTLVVHFTANISVSKQTNFTITSRCISVATPKCAWINCFDFIFENISETNWRWCYNWTIDLFRVRWQRRCIWQPWRQRRRRQWIFDFLETSRPIIRSRL